MPGLKTGSSAGSAWTSASTAGWLISASICPPTTLSCTAAAPPCSSTITGRLSGQSATTTLSLTAESSVMPSSSCVPALQAARSTALFSGRVTRASTSPAMTVCAPPSAPRSAPACAAAVSATRTSAATPASSAMCARKSSFSAGPRWPSLHRSCAATRETVRTTASSTMTMKTACSASPALRRCTRRSGRF